MDRNPRLGDYSNVIEGILCAFDMDHDERIKDSVAIKILELLLDKYHFNERVETFDSDLIKEGFEDVDEAIESDLNNVLNDQIVKVLGVIYFVAKRRSKGGREYMSVIQNYVGPRIGCGLHALPQINRSF